MAEYLHPGVYIEETSYRSAPLEGVSTSTAGLVGRTRKGPVGRPTLVTSFTEFVRTFGSPFPIVNGTAPQLGDYLGHAVRAFFDNGGKRAYIVRVLADDAQAATTSLDVGQVYLLPGFTTVRGPTSTLPLNTVRGIDGSDSLDVYARGTVTPRFTVLAGAVDLPRNAISSTINAGITLAPGSTYLLHQGTTLAVGGPVFTADSPGEDGNAISVQIRPSDGTAMKLVAPRFFKSKPVVASYSGQPGNVGPTGPTPITSTDVLPLGLINVGDTLAFDGPGAESAPITKIQPAASITIPATTTNPGTVSTGVVALHQRGAAIASSDIPVYALGAGESVVVGAANITMPYGAAALLRAGDAIAIGSSTAVLGIIPDLTAMANTVDIALTTTHPTTTVTITATGEIDPGTHVKRLLVGDTTGLAAPYATTPQPIAITDGANVIAATVLLVDGASNTVIVKAASSVPDAWTSFELLRVTGATNAVPVASTSGFYTGAVVELFDGSISTGAYFTVAAVDPGARTVTLVGGSVPAIDLPADPTARKVFLRTLEIDVLVYENGTLVETFSGQSWNNDPTVDSFRRYFVNSINDADTGSQLVSVTWAGPATLDPTSQPNTPDGFPLALGGGTNGSPLDATALIGHDNGPNQRTGIAALVDKKDIALVAVPGVTDEAVQQALLTHCELLKYRFAILDGRQGISDITAIETHRGNYDSLYGGYYVPWLKTLDLDTGNTMFAPPSGYVLGICARVDNSRGVHKAPANEVVQNILDVELPFNDGEQDVLNPLGINLIREFETRGIRVWGARTTSSDPEWRYVNVRRLFIFLEHSIDNGTQWVVFEPNNEALWERVKETIQSFLFGVWKSGALMGTKPEEAYFVRCDRTTMTQDDIDNGRLVCLIGVAPTYPAEFVIFRIGQFTASSNQA